MYLAAMATKNFESICIHMFYPFFYIFLFC
nr:MAG TPA: hypothetical protein [Caudoviricetes sp.]DAZ46008.1 MAG TPA: hypothetical protein [Caudoviricetes sp.]